MSTQGSSSYVINVEEPNIYKIPEHIARENPKFYQPQLVFLGPCSRYKSAWDESSAIKELKTSPDAVQLKEASDYEPLLKLCHELTPSYKDSKLYYPYEYTDTQKNLEFMRMMVEDGVFILEILRLGTRDSIDNHNSFLKLFTSLGYKNDVPIFKQDMLLLENQVPFWLLEYLLLRTDAGIDNLELDNYKARDQTGKRKELLDCIIKFYSLPESTRNITPPYLHILDIYRRGRISQVINKDETKNIKVYVRDKAVKYFPSASKLIYRNKTKDKHDEAAQYFPSASKLYEAAIPFKQSRTANLKDVSYHRGTLQLPPFLITKDTTQTLANLIAFEKLHDGAGNEITSYVFVLNCLIHNARDVSLLESEDVIHHTLRDDEDVVKSIGLISNDVAYPPDNMLEDIQIVSQQLRYRRFKKKINMWRLDLLKNYLNTPWGALSVFGAILLFVLGTTQTVYAVLSFIHRRD